MRYFIDGSGDGALPPAKIARWRGFLATNAESLWRSQSAEGTFPLWWGAATPPIFPMASVNMQTAAIDAFVAASTPSSSPPLSLSLQRRSTAGSCSGAGKKVRGGCVCRTRFTGAACQEEISWLEYFSTWTSALGRSAVIMTSTSHFLSSSPSSASSHTSSKGGSGNPFVYAVSHVTGDEAWAIHSCGADGAGNTVFEPFSCCHDIAQHCLLS